MHGAAGPSHLLFYHPAGEVLSGVTTIQRGSETAQDALLRLGQVFFQVAETTGQLQGFGVLWGCCHGR